MLMNIYAEVSSIPICEASAATVRIVSRCPTDLKSWKIAAQNMKCESINQSCSDRLYRHIYQYHCVINAWMNATLEVCAPNRTIFGYCTEYNAMGRVIQENYNAECKNYDPPCPSFYNSAEAYKYQNCYQLVKTNLQSIGYSNEDSKQPFTSTSKGLRGNIAGIFLSILLVFKMNDVCATSMPTYLHADKIYNL